MSVVVIGVNHQTAPVPVREQIAFPDAAIPNALAALRQKGLAHEGVILSTCNRVELYAATALPPPQSFQSLQSFLLETRNARQLNGSFFYTKSEPQSLEHLFRVACGLDSMVLGETEILGQLKHAYELAMQHRHTGALLNKAFQKAFNVAKQIRTETQIQRGAVSVANVAVELAEKVFASLEDHPVLIIGTGDTGEKTARALLSRGAKRILVTNRTLETAQALAEDLGGQAIPFHAWEECFAQVDIVISSTSAPHYILDSHRLQPLMSLRKNRPLLLVDIAVPRDIDPEVNLMDNVFLYNIDDLQAIADESLKQRQQEIVRCEALICERVQALIGGRNAQRPINPPPSIQNAHEF